MISSILLPGCAAVLSMGIVPLPALALQGPNNPSLLIMNPVPLGSDGQAYAVELGNMLRDRLIGRLRFKVRAFSTDQICEVLVQSGFECGTSFDPVMVDQLASAVNIDSYATWTVSRNGDSSSVTMRLIDRRRSGVSGWFSANFSGTETRRFADQIVDSLDQQLNVARHARGCYDRRNRQDYRGARQRAERAFRERPNHPSAAICLSTVFESSQQPADSIIWALRKALAGDSLLSRSWQRLGQNYMQIGDTAQAVEAFARYLAINPNDREARLGVAAIYYGLGDYQRTRETIEPAVEQNPNDLQILRIWTEACLDGEMWDCALESLERRYEVDSLLHGNEAFYGMVFGAAQALGDTVAMLRWSGEAVERVPESLFLWRARAQALNDAGIADSALAAYLRIVELDPADFRSTLSAAEIVIAGLVIDSLVPLDTSAVNLADSLLRLTVARDTSAATKTNVALRYLQPAARLASNKHYEVAMDWLDRSLENDMQGGQITTQANFYWGFSAFFVVGQLDNLAVDTEDCSIVAREAELVELGAARLRAGRSVSPGFADQILPFFDQYEARIPQLRQAWSCN